LEHGYEISAAMADGFGALRDRGAPPEIVELIAAAGVPAVAACRAVEAGIGNRLRRLVVPQSKLSAAERQRLERLASLATEVMDLQGGALGAAKWWNEPTPRLRGDTPAEALVQNDGIAVIEDLLVRIAHGIPR
jgi:uncharacterized protein (DUF2384 family)